MKYYCLSGFTSVLRDQRFSPSRDDMAALKRISRSATSALDRAQASFTRGYCRFIAGDRDGAARSYREALASAAASDVPSRVILPNPATQSYEPTACGPLLDLIARDARENLAEFGRFGRSATATAEAYAVASRDAADRWASGGGQGPAPPLPFRMQAVYASGSGRDGPEAALALHQHIKERTSVGGSACDTCKLIPAAGETLKLCRRCKLAYYCSATCQKKAWKTGHKRACRKPGKIVPGDWVRLSGVSSKPELNGCICEVVGSVPNREGRWEVTAIGQDERSMSIAADKLGHLRPADICSTVIDPEDGREGQVELDADPKLAAAQVAATAVGAWCEIRGSRQWHTREQLRERLSAGEGWLSTAELPERRADNGLSARHCAHCGSAPERLALTKREDAPHEHEDEADATRKADLVCVECSVLDFMVRKYECEGLGAFTPPEPEPEPDQF